MAYFLRISRNSDQQPIAWNDWEDYVSRHPDLSFDHTESAGFQAHAAYWHHDPENRVTWEENELYVKYPTAEFFGILLQIATDLDAGIQDDEGRVLSSADDFAAA